MTVFKLKLSYPITVAARLGGRQLSADNNKLESLVNGISPPRLSSPKNGKRDGSLFIRLRQFAFSGFKHT